MECVTYALATQLVVSMPGPLSDAGAQELAAIWAELRAFGEDIEGVPLAELRERLTGFETRILAVVRNESTEQPAGEPAATATGGAESSPSASPSGTSDPAATSTAGAETTATGAAGPTG